jgi:hypothetical protein
MVDWSPSEFSRLRLQYARDDSREDTDDQVYLQYIMTLGAHGVHRWSAGSRKPKDSKASAQWFIIANGSTCWTGNENDRKYPHPVTAIALGG